MELRRPFLSRFKSQRMLVRVRCTVAAQQAIIPRQGRAQGLAGLLFRNRNKSETDPMV
jgi:hypothetical protein